MRTTEAAPALGPAMSPLSREGPTPRDRWALPSLGPGDRLLLRAAGLLARSQIIAIRGLQYISPDRDPFILAMNHGTRREVVLVPPMLFLHRGGRLIHFLADWNFRLIPGIGLIYARAQVITVTRKSARPRVLNVLKSLYEHPLSALEQARAHLIAGRPVGIFPEGSVNDDPNRLLRGRGGASRLSLQTGIPVVPAGIRFPQIEPGRPIPPLAPMELHIGTPMTPPGRARNAHALGEARAWHATIMREIARLCGKTWTHQKSEVSHDQARSDQG